MKTRRWVTLLTTLTFVVLAVTGVLAFILPFSLQIIGLHSLMGFLFIALVALHVGHSRGPMKRHLRSPILWATLAVSVVLSLLFWLQPQPVRAILGLSGNLGPAQERFEMLEDEMVFHYTPAPSYKMQLRVRTGTAYSLEQPPQIAIWLENQGAYHIKTLLAPEADSARHLTYWSFKREGWQKAREEAEKTAEVDIISSDTPNGSFDPKDYILPADPDNPMPYRLLIEVDLPQDDQPSLVYAVEIDNAAPQAFQLLDLMGYPEKEIDDDGKVEWPLYYVDYSDEQFRAVLELIDSALLTIDRG